MEQVSRKIEGGIESAYFDVQYRPSIDHSNFKLNLNCSSLLTYMALADITRKDRGKGECFRCRLRLLPARCQAGRRPFQTSEPSEEISVGGKRCSAATGGSGCGHQGRPGGGLSL